ncbi:T-cell ecto-ADP-ribosyltransferase 1-like [Talpa occidentalis]|uniref:T-cell ecto-ADP-ribosyltransferase 1-like n=1 Tax=Talpa occidentalis TaxID=50954 RepID=UPI0023F682F9|nr:T-cell ecto-ADP-ribosyltransferase 1-like [Talpa occidentalis]
MTSLLATAVHFLILTQVTGLAWEGESCQLDMAETFFDDQYEGCTEQMEAKAHQLLTEELEANKTVKSAWEEAAKHWDEIKDKIKGSIKNLEKLNAFQATAVVAYTGPIGTDFTKAIREFKSKKFRFKAFHYYLTTALQLLHEKKEYTVFRGSQARCNYPGKGNVRFGQFASSSLSREQAIEFIKNKEGTLLTIQTTLGVDISKLSLIPQQQEVLIPGYEEYQDITAQPSTGKFNEFSLKNPQKSKSFFNCYNSSGMREISVFLLLLPGLLMLLLIHAEL